MNPLPAVQPTEPIEEQFRRLLDRWRAETVHLSSSTRLTGHPAYQAIIALGPPVLPSLFRELERRRDGHLSKALTAITGTHPVAAEDRGRIERIAEAWLKWGRENGYQW